MNVYPSVEELMPNILKSRIPDTLARDIEERYTTLGGKYLTEKSHHDGRLINNMMFSNRIQECLEEVVDAVFCVLGWIFKYTTKGEEPPNVAFSALTGLIEIYSILYVQREIDLVA